MQKLLFVTRTLNGRGGQIILANLIRELRAQGYDVHFVAFKPTGTNDFSVDAPLYQGLDPEVVIIPQHNDYTLQMQEYIDGTAAYLQQHQAKYQKVILDSWWTMLAGIVAGVNSAKTYHFVQSDPEFTPKDTTGIWESRLFSMLPLYPLPRIVVSRSIQTLFKERYGIEYPHIDLYIDDAYRAAGFRVRDRTGPIKFISSAGDFSTPSKGLDFLLESLVQLDQPCELTLLSGTPIKQDLTRYPFSIKIATARIPQEMIAHLQKHDVYVNTSTKETFCLALAEAVTLGMPCIALDSVGNRDYSQGNNFIFVKNPDTFVGQLRRITALEERQKLHKYACASMERYTLNTMVAQFKKLTGLSA